MITVPTCPSCHGNGYEAVAEDEVAPCTHPNCVARAVMDELADARREVARAESAVDEQIAYMRRGDNYRDHSAQRRMAALWRALRNAERSVAAKEAFLAGLAA